MSIQRVGFVAPGVDAEEAAKEAYLTAADNLDDVRSKGQSGSVRPPKVHILIVYLLPRPFYIQQDLISGLHDFLADQGVDAEFVESLASAVGQKEQNDYVAWLKDLQKFTK